MLYFRLNITKKLRFLLGLNEISPFRSKNACVIKNFKCEILYFSLNIEKKKGTLSWSKKCH